MRSMFACIGIVTLGALAPTAAAQPGQAPPPPGYRSARPVYYAPPPPLGRRGLTLGVGLALGTMEADSGPLRCDGCDFDPLAGGFDLHIGGMIRPNLALLFELQLTAQQLDAVGAETLRQVMLMGAVQYWLMPMLWIKGGLGTSSLSIGYDDGYGEEDLDTGVGVLAAVGLEVLHAPRFAVDLQLRLSSGSYGGLDDEIHAAMLGLGLSWY